MRNRLPCLAFALAVLIGAAWSPSPGGAATCTLVPKKPETGGRSLRFGSASTDWLYTFTEGQSFFVQFQPKSVVKDGKEETTWTAMGGDSRLERFNKLAKKQPEKYNTSCPFRGVAKLGDKEYPFVLDAPEADSQSYGLLYFDLNGNGDLTDDGVIESNEAKKAREGKEAAEKAKAEAEAKAKAEGKAADEEKKADDEKKVEKKAGVLAPAVYVAPVQHQFPAVELTIEVDGKKVEYRFFLSIYSFLRREFAYASATLNAGLYYEGEIELGGRKQKVVLVDFNSNGRFDDKTKINNVRYGGMGGPERLYPQRGDVLFLDPKPIADPRLVYDATGPEFRHNVEKLLCLDGKYYALKVTAAGDTLSIEPSDVALGAIKNPSAEYSAVLSGKQGTIRIKGAKDEPAPVPEGEWKLVSCIVDLTNVKPPEKKPDEKTAGDDKKQASLWEAIGKAVGAAAGANVPARGALQTRTSRASAMGTTDGKPIKVVKGETVVLPFGPPYHNVVQAQYFQSGNDTLHLGLDIVGSGGEVLTDLTVKGGRPGKPTIKILEADGKVASEGNFEYG